MAQLEAKEASLQRTIDSARDQAAELESRNNNLIDEVIGPENHQLVDHRLIQTADLLVGELCVTACLVEQVGEERVKYMQLENRAVLADQNVSGHIHTRNMSDSNGGL